MAEKRSSAVTVPVTEGSIRNGYVHVRDVLWFFPKSAIRDERRDRGGAEPCVLELDGLGEIETDIDPNKGMFRWRGWKRFFRLHEVGAGDELVFSKRNRNHFDVRVEHRVLNKSAPVPSPSNGRGIRPSRRTTDRCNDLSGDEWLRYSLSIWSDIKKTPEEAALKHPAMFPTMLCERLMSMFLRRRGKHRVLDPFMGSGSTLVAARTLGKIGVGFEISDSYISLAKERLDAPQLFGGTAVDYEIHGADARKLLDFVRPASIDLCITSPPYWDILNQRRTADYKDVRHYGNMDADLGIIGDYDAFLTELAAIFSQVYAALKPGAYCVVVVMDLRKKDRFFPLHSDLSDRLMELGFTLDDLIIWDRGREYNNLRPLGYPAVFRVNKIHEFVLIFQKPKP